MKRIKLATSQIIFSVAVLLFLGTISNLVHAQEAGARGIEEIIVTSQRRSESIQDIGASVTAIGAEDLVQRNITNITDLVFTTPSLGISTPFGAGGTPIFQIRGAATADPFSLNQSRPIALYMDEGIRNLGALEITPIYDVERVEVLKGPQGSLYGRNAVGGAINVISHRPDFETEGYLTLGYGNFDRIDARGAIQVPLVDDRLAARAAFVRTDSDGVVNNAVSKDLDETDIVSGRLSLLFTPSENFTGLLRTYYTKVKNNGYGAIATSDPGLIYGPAASREGLGFYDENTDVDASGRAVNKGVNLQMTYETEAVLLTSITTYDEGEWKTRNDDDHTPLDLIDDVYAIDDIQQFSQEIRLQSNGDGLFQWLIGGSYGEDESEVMHRFLIFNAPIFNPGPPGDPFNFAFNYGNQLDQERDNFAVYARGDYDITAELNVFAGVRYSEDTVEVVDLDVFQDFTVPHAFGTPGFDFGTFAPLTDLSRKTDSNNVSFEVGANYQFNDNLLLYANFKQGYRGPALNAQTFFFADELSAVNEETVDAYEAGFKWEYRSRLRLNAAVFYNEYEDLQTLETVPGVTENTFVLRLVNAAKSDTLGLEWELEALVTNALTLRFSGTLSDPEYKSYVSNGIDVAGNQPFFSSKLVASIGADLELMRNDMGILLLNASALHQSDTYFNQFELEHVSDPGHWIANARLSWKTVNDRWTVSVWGKNLLADDYFTYGFDLDSFLGYSYRNRGMPRSYGAEITFSY